jgi:tRNA threonylcarbamoyl adenosine modification protein YeaZ
MHILSFDTGSHELHLSLLNDREPVLERRVLPESGERQEVASRLMPEIDIAFNECGWQRDQLGAIVVGVGPGSFTGIRVAVITGRTLAQIFKLPLIGVSMLETWYVGLETSEPAAIILGSTSGQYFYAAYEATAGDPAHILVGPGCAPGPDVVDALKAIPTWYGDEKAVAGLAEHPVKPLPKLKNIGTIQAQLAVDRVSLNALAAETFAWQNVLPLYLRSPSVTLKKNYAAPNSANDPR